MAEPASLIEKSLDRSIPVSQLLRAAAITAKRLEQDESARWIDHELTGYPKPDDVPSYRQVGCQLWYSDGWRNGPIEVRIHEDMDPDRTISNLMESMGLVQSIPELELWVQRAQDGHIHRRLPKEIVDYLRIGLPQGDRATLSHVVQAFAIERIFEAVRTKVMQWALDLEAAGVKPGKASYSPSEQQYASSIVLNIQHNSGTSVAIHTGNGTLNATQSSRSSTSTSVDETEFRKDVVEIIHRVVDRIDVLEKNDLAVLQKMRALKVDGLKTTEVYDMIQDLWIRETGRDFSSATSRWWEMTQGIGSSLIATALWQAFGLS